MDRPIFIDTCSAARPRPCARSSSVLRDTYCGTDRRRVHAHPGPGAEGLDPAPHRRRALAHALRRRRQADHPAAADRGRGLRDVLPAPLCRHQALRPRGRRGHHPGAARDHRDRGARRACSEIAIGMPHRGRLNTLVNIVQEAVHRAVQRVRRRSSFKPDDVQGSGDVKYHLGTSTDIEIDGQHGASLAAAQSVASRSGRSRWWSARCARGRTWPATPRRGARSMGILMHGDAAFAGQGLVYETLAMSQLIGYRTGGTVHVDRQQPDRLHHRSGARLFRPLLHRCREMRSRRRSCTSTATIRKRWCGARAWPPSSAWQFGTDIVLDIVCYRRHGHNETDEPAFTQPIMYRAIDAHADDPRALCRAAGARGRGRPRPTRKAMWDDFTATPGSRLPGGARPTSRTRPTGWKATGPA